MEKYANNDIVIRLLDRSETIPYELLLLADETVKDINKYIFDSEIYVAELNCIKEGVCVLKAVNHQTMEIKNIAVREHLQGKRIGSLLISYVSQLAANRGFSYLIVGTCDHCLKEINFYKKSGFRDYKITRNYFPDNYDHAIYENGNKIIDLVVLKKILRSG